MDISEVILKLEAGVELLKRYQGTMLPREKEMLEAERTYQEGEANKTTSFGMDSDPIKQSRDIRKLWGGKSEEEKAEIKARLAKGSKNFRAFVKDINQEKFMQNFKGKGKRKAQSLLYKNRDNIDKIIPDLGGYEGNESLCFVQDILKKY